MKQLFDDLSMKCSKNVTTSYSTSFAWAVNMLAPRIRPAIHSIYGFVRLADEIVDSFHDWDKKELLDKFENDFYEALEKKISLNPILNSFQHTVHRYQIDLTLIQAFLRSMRMDLEKKEYTSIEEYEAYIYGSADVVGLMCLKVFVNGDHKKYDELNDSAQKLGSAFQKVNFLRDIKDDMEILNRSYFPHIDLNNLEKESKEMIIAEIENDFSDALQGIVHLPNTSKFGVYTAYIYYRQLLKKLKETPSSQIMEIRIRVADYFKMILLIKSYFSIKLKLI
jgi:phytoene synthase